MEKRVQDYSKEILKIIRSNTSPAVMGGRLQDYHENDLADVMPKLTVQERCKLYRILDIDMLSDIFEYTDSDNAAEYVKEMDVKKGAAILSRMETDALVEVLQKIEKAKKKILVELMDDDVRHDIEMIASFDEDEIGSRMTTNFIMIHNNLTIRQAMRELIEQAGENDNISTIYVIDDEDKFYGAIDLKDLIIAREYTDLEDLISHSYPYVKDHEKVADCIEQIKDYAEDSIPVLQEDGTIAGIITSQDIVEAVDDEMGEDYAKLAGLTAEEDLNEKLAESVKKRLPWLVILLFLGMVVSSVVGAFESVVAVIPIVMCFQSLILDMAGNVGTQSLAVTIRVLMDEELTAKQKLMLVVKEMKIGFVNGLFLGVMAWLFLGIYICVIKGYPIHHALLVSGCVGIALVTAMVISSMVGTLIPMFFKKINVDPAVASGPLITTVNDLVAIVVYYGLAMLFLVDLLHVTG